MKTRSHEQGPMPSTRPMRPELEGFKGSFEGSFKDLGFRENSWKALGSFEGSFKGSGFRF